MTVVIRWRWFRNYVDVTRLEALREILRQDKKDTNPAEMSWL